MIHDLKLRKVGDSVGVILPPEALAHLHAAEGDSVRLTESPDGSLRIIPSVDAGDQLDRAEDIIRRYPKTLRDLAQ